MLTNKDFVNFVRNCLSLKTKYMWGEYGRIITNNTIAAKSRQYPIRYSTARQNILRACVGKKYYGCDCAGLIKWFLWTNGGTTSIKYNTLTDRNCTGLYKSAANKGPINTLPEIEGVLVWKGNHVGVYIGDGEVIECTLGTYGDGVVKTKLQGRGWTDWLMLKEIVYIANEEEKPWIPAVADIVVYNGNTHYISANASKGRSCRGGKAKITRIYQLGKSKHPYHLVNIRGGGANVYGWVDIGTFTKS